MKSFHLRVAKQEDALAIARIYAHYVLNSTCTFEDIPPGADEIVFRMHKVLDAGLPFYVAEGRGAILGYAYASPFHPRVAYRYTVENSVYVDQAHMREGIGLALMTQLICECTSLGRRQMIALISESEASVALHKKLGFRELGTLSSVGFKFGRWVNVTEMQLALGEGAGSLPKS